MPGIDEHTLLMLHFDDSSEDSSQYRQTVTSTGAAFSTDAKFGVAAAGSFAAQKGFRIANNPNLNFGTGDFTIDCWVKFNDVTAGYQPIFDRRGTQDPFGYLLTVETTNDLRFYAGNGSSWAVNMTIGSIAAYQNQYIHVAIVRNGAVFTLYINGQAAATATSDVNIVAVEQDPMIGVGSPNISAGLTSAYYLHGVLDELRVSNVARWTSNFTPPTQPYSPPVEAPRIKAPASAISGKTFLVSWTAVADAASYTLEQQVDGGSWEQVYTGAATSWQAAAEGKTMGFRVKAADGDGNESEYAQSGEVKIFPSLEGKILGGVI